MQPFSKFIRVVRRRHIVHGASLSINATSVSGQGTHTMLLYNARISNDLSFSGSAIKLLQNIELKNCTMPFSYNEHTLFRI